MTKTLPLVPCPYGDKHPVDLAYYLRHQADFALRGPKPEDAELYMEAVKWLEEKTND